MINDWLMRYNGAISPVRNINCTKFVPQYRKPKNQNTIAPMNGYFFRLKIIAAIINRVGMRCMNNAPMVPRNPSPISNTSKANILINRVNKIDTILGNRKRNLCEFFFISGKALIY